MADSLSPINPNPGSERDPRNFVGRISTTRRAEDMLRAGQSNILDYMARVNGWVPFQDLETAMKVSSNREAFLQTYDNLYDDHYLVEKSMGGRTEVAWRYPVIRAIYRQRRRLE